MPATSNQSAIAQQQRRFIVIVYCVMALAAVAAAWGVKWHGAAAGLSGPLAHEVATGFAWLALFNVVALFAIQALGAVLRRRSS